MSTNYKLITDLVQVKPNDREDLLAALVNISCFDCDFNGDNGLEYLWEEVWNANGYQNYNDYQWWLDNAKIPELKYESNLDYLVDKVANIEDDIECVRTYIREWMNHDNYYVTYRIDYLVDNFGNVTTISWSAICD